MSGEQEYPTEDTKRRLHLLETEPDKWVRENARGMLTGRQCCQCCAHIINAGPPPMRRVICPACVAENATGGFPSMARQNDQPRSGTSKTPTPRSRDER